MSDRVYQVKSQTLFARCKYCWFRRLEIEGLVDRWLICGGQPQLYDDPDDDVTADLSDAFNEEVSGSAGQEAEAMPMAAATTRRRKSNQIARDF